MSEIVPTAAVSTFFSSAVRSIASAGPTFSSESDLRIKLTEEMLLFNSKSQRPRSIYC